MILLLPSLLGLAFGTSHKQQLDPGECTVYGTGMSYRTHCGREGTLTMGVCSKKKDVHGTPFGTDTPKTLNASPGVTLQRGVEVRG